MSNQQDYFNEVYQTAVKLGANPTQAKLAASQASLETGYGKSVKGNNHFGIKAGSKYNGKTVDFATHEVYGGKKTAITDKFRAYDGLAGSVKGYLEFMPKAFPSAWNAPDFESASANLNAGKQGGYATDPKYASKLNWLSGKFGKDISAQEAPKLSFNDTGLPTGLDTPIPNGYDTPTAQDSSPFSAVMNEQPKPKGFAALVPSQQGGKLTFDKPWQQNGLESEIQDVVSGAGQEIGENIYVNSGHRPLAYNRKIGSSDGSYHVKKKAMDISMAGMADKKRQDLVKNMTQRGAGGFITYDKSPDMMHVDMRKRGESGTPHFMHNFSSRNMGSAPEWYQKSASKGGITLPQGADIPKPSFRNQSQSYAAPRGNVERGGNLPAPIDQDTNLYGASPSDYANYQSSNRSSAMPRGDVAPKPSFRPQVGQPESQSPFPTSMRGAPSRSVQRTDAAPASTVKQESQRYHWDNNTQKLTPTPVKTQPEYAPKASDYANYMMGAPAPTPPQTTIAGPIGQPMAGVPIPAPRPTKIDRFKQKAGSKLKEHFKPQTVAARMAGGLIGGPMGAMAGPKIAQFINQRGFNGKGLSMPKFGNKQALSPFQSWGNNSSNRMQNAMSGPRGATNTASNGSQATSLGNGQYTYYSPGSGKTSVKGEIDMNKSADLRSFFGN